MSLTLAGCIVGAFAEFANLPTWLLLAGLTAVIVGTVTAVVFAFSSSRRDGTSVVRSLASAVKIGFGWGCGTPCLRSMLVSLVARPPLDSPTG